MAVIKLLLIVCGIIPLTRCDCPASSSITTLSKLKQALTCDYDPYARPVLADNHTTSLYFRLILKYFLYEAGTSTLSLDAWMPTGWTDEHLKWNPKDYDNISSIHFHTSEIWTPDLSVFNRASQGGNPTTIGSIKCIVTSKGKVICVVPVHIDSLCVPNLTMYPFDKQRCNLRIGSWSHRGEEIDVNVGFNVISTNGSAPNGEWQIIDYTVQKHLDFLKCCPNDTYTSIEIVFNLQRLSGAHAASVVIPTVVAVLLTLTSLILSPLNKDRLALCYVNVIAQFMHVQFASWQVPLKGDKTPLILLFSRDSLLLAIFTIVFTLWLNKLMKKTTMVSSPISFIASNVVTSRIGQFIFSEEKSVKGLASASIGKGEEDGAWLMDITSSSGNGAWMIFGRILDSILLVAYFIVYFVMLMRFVQ